MRLPKGNSELQPLASKKKLKTQNSRILENSNRILVSALNKTFLCECGDLQLCNFSSWGARELHDSAL
jgi:hypothetical protein